MRSIKLVAVLVVSVASMVLAADTWTASENQFVSKISLFRAQEVPVDSLTLSASEGMMYHADTPFTGYATRQFSNGRLSEKVAYIKGKKQGVTIKWYPSGAVSFKGAYVQNRRDGTVRTWWPDGTLRTESNYVAGAPHGIQRQWYQSGALFKELHLEEGKESGLQRAWRENGKLYANYEAIDGRIYGLKRANLCYDLDGETIQSSIQ